MSDNLPTIAFRADLLSRCRASTQAARNGIAQWTSLYSAVQSSTLEPGLGELLRSAWLSGLVTAVETVLGDTLLEVLVAYPTKLSKKQLTVEELNESGSYLAAVTRVARRAVNDLSYVSISEYLVTWQRYVGPLSGVTPDQIDVFAEIKATRDLYVHNSGRTNEVYKRKAGLKSRRPNRDSKLPIDEQYLTTASQLSATLVAAISATVEATYPSCTPEAVFEEMWNATCCGKMVDFEKQWEVKKRPYHRKNFTWGWSSSEKGLFDFFLRIFHGESADVSTEIRYALYKWPGDTPEGAVIRSWIEHPFQL